MIWHGLLYAALPIITLSFPDLVKAVQLTVSKTGGNASSPLLYGFMFEVEISYSGDGGIHAQLLRNNGFQGDNPDLTAYVPVGDVDLSVDTRNPLSDAIVHSLKVSIRSRHSGQVGFSNQGYWGIPVNEGTYRSAFYIKGAYSGPVTLRLVGADSHTDYASTTIEVFSTSKEFTFYEVSFPVKQAPDGNNVWTLTFDSARAPRGALYFDLIQLYPPTFHNRENGLKPSLAEHLVNYQGSFLRFPGGNNLEGLHPSSRWKWDKTIGLLKKRPGRQGTWGYPNSDALGLFEYLTWCEDMHLAPLLVVWDGLSIGGEPGDVITGEALEPYIEDVLDELQYIRGDKSTMYGALRASHGHPEPFALSYVQIGNEDNQFGGLESYPERFMRFYNAIRKEHPDLTILTSTRVNLPEPKPPGIWLDYHNYSGPATFVASFNMFDNVDRRFPQIVGEYACIEDENGAPLLVPNMQCTVAEAVFLIGIERNSDVVKMSAYAPLFGRIGQSQHTPNMIDFNNDPYGVVLSTSYYATLLFSRYRGHTILPVQSDTPFGPMYWVASKASGAIIVKLANYGPVDQAMAITIPGTTKAKLKVISGPPHAGNTYGSEEVEPRLLPVDGNNGLWGFLMPAWGVGVLIVH